MDLGLKIIPPQSTSESLINEVGEDLKNIEGVQGSGTTRSRAIDPVSIIVWVKLSAEVIAAAGAAVTLAQHILNLLHKKKMSGAIVEFANGTKVTIDNASAEDIAQLIKAGICQSG